MKLKKILIPLAIIIVLLLGALIAAPIIFKDQIKATIDEQIAANINADVLFEIDNFSLSLLPNFPNITASIKELGIVGRDKFVGEVLFAVDEFDIEVNLMKLLFDEQMSIQGISLLNPKIFIKVLADGTANYDIVKSTDETEVDTLAETSDFSMAIENWQISGGHVIYNDATIPTYLEMEKLNHTGSGNFSLSIFDLSTNTDVVLKKISYDGERYISNRHLNMDLILNMDLEQMKFTFKENQLALNDFSFGFDGWVSMPADDIDMELSFASRNNTFKSLISLIPAIYTEDFSDLKSSGTVRFDGEIKGTYNDNSMPAFKVNLAVNEGMFQYPDLPEAVKNVEVVMMVASEDGNIDHTKIDITKFHVDFGQEPFDGFIKIDNLINYPIDMGIKTTLNLGHMAQMFPIEGLQMEGIFMADIKAKGIYDSVKAIIPKVDAAMSLTNAKIIYADLPAPLTDLNFTATINNTTGKLNDTKLAIPSFKMDLDGSPINGALLLENFDNYHWEAALEGNLNFGKLFPIINKLYPLPGTEMDGEIAAYFKTEGNMADVDAEHYERLTTSGSLIFNNFNYTDSLYLPQGMTIKSGEFAFDPQQIKVKAMTAVVGNSDFSADGIVSNYINYLFNDNETINGNIGLRSNKIDLNEWMTEEVTTEETEESEPYTVIEVPKNIDFIMQADISQILYEDLVLRDAKGKILVKNGILYLDNLTTSTLGGSIVFNGNYDTQNMSKPSFNMGLGITSIDIKQSYSAFNTIQALAPLAKNVDGKASTNFSLAGLLQPDMMPDLKTLTGSGLLAIKNAELSNSKLVSGLTSYLKGSASDKLNLKDMAMKLSINNGRLHVQPFDVKINSYNANVGGSTGIDGSLEYAIKMDVPAGQVGSQVNALLGSLTGSTNASDIIKINLGLGGTYNDPKMKLLGTDSKKVAKKAAVNQLVKVAGGNQILADSLQNTNVKDLVADQKKIAEAELKKQQDSLKKVAEEEVAKAKEKALEEAGKQLKNLFGPKKKKN